ncbi:MAG TPA: excisionase family DNA-binding protein [Bellilinea sp.]|nr:excisionase family DNA-binding protein [Bellilinea sp.]
MDRKETKKEQWLSLSLAAQVLGVHFTTLRRWADDGVIEYMRTPGGRRKFRVDALQAFVQDRTTAKTEERSLATLHTKVIAASRGNLHHPDITSQRWFTDLDTGEREAMRNSGNRLLALLFQYCTRNGEKDAFLHEGIKIARGYGRMTKSSGFSLEKSMDTFMFFRRTMLNSIYETSSLQNLPNDESQQVFQRMNFFFDTLMLEMVAEFEAS